MLRLGIWLISVICCGFAVADDTLDQAVSLYQQGLLDEAQVSFEGIQHAGPQRADTYYYLGLIHQSRGDYMQAADYFEKAVDRDKQQSKYYQGLGEAYGSAVQSVSVFKKMRLAGKIRDAFERAVELDGDNIEARSGLITYYVNAPGIAGGSNEKAMEQAREIARRDTYRGHLSLASIYQSQDDDTAVVREYRAAIEDSPDAMIAYLALGIYLTSQERFDEAMQIYETALQKNPDDMGITYQVGRTASISGDYQDLGITAFSRYLDYTPKPDEPGLDWANYRLGLIYQQQGKTEQAKHHYQQALVLNSDHPEAEKALKKIGR